MIWESKELETLRDMRHDLTNAWSYTELDQDGASQEHLLDNLKALSMVINKAVTMMDNELDRLSRRDADVFKDMTCSCCESSKIYICSDCLTEMSKNVS